jgi:hypothetical protein
VTPHELFEQSNRSAQPKRVTQNPGDGFHFAKIENGPFLFVSGSSVRQAQ